MEAIPKLPMLYFELKISLDKPDFATPFKRVSISSVRCKLVVSVDDVAASVSFNMTHEYMASVLYYVLVYSRLLSRGSGILRS